MTIKESSVCGVVQSFPILLILAQKYEKCLKTPLVYEPPKPSPSPEYYAALDALFQNLFGGHEPHSPGCAYAARGYGYGSKPSPGHPCYFYAYPSYEYSSGHGLGHGPGHSLGHGYGYGGGGYTLPAGAHGAAYPVYGYKRVSVYNKSGTPAPAHGYKGTYAPTQVYNINHKYKVVVKKNRKGRPHKLQGKLNDDRK